MFFDAPEASIVSTLLGGIALGAGLTSRGKDLLYFLMNRPRKRGKISLANLVEAHGCLHGVDARLSKARDLGGWRRGEQFRQGCLCAVLVLHGGIFGWWGCPPQIFRRVYEPGPEGKIVLMGRTGAR